MKIKLSSESFTDGYINAIHSKQADTNQCVEGVPYINFSFTVDDIDPDHNYLSWVLIDYDSNPVVQFSWLHWVIGNFKIENKSNINIPINLQSTKLKYTSGINSFASPLTNISDPRVCLNYGGPTPPDCTHNYTLHVFSHEHKLDLQTGFYYNQLRNELSKQHISSSKAQFLATN